MGVCDPSAESSETPQHINTTDYDVDLEGASGDESCRPYGGRADIFAGTNED